MPYFIEKRLSQKELETNHILVGEISDASNKSSIFTFIFKAILIFIAAYSSIAGLLSAFDITYRKNIIFLFFLFFSFYVSFLYKNKILFYLGYIALFFGFTIELARYFFYANSGFQAVVNIIYEEYSDFFELSSVRQAQELYQNRTVTITYAAVFIGIFLIILLNITISGYMNFPETFIITFPFLEIAFYIGKKPQLIYIILLFSAYLCIALLQGSRFSRTQVKGKHTHQFARIKSKKRQLYYYQSNTGTFIVSGAAAILLAVTVCLSMYSLYYRESVNKADNEIHKKTNEYVKIFVQTGFTGFLNSYASTGGLSGGRLGGVSQVRPDFQTDLTVTFSPYSYQTVYLKGFTGNTYSSGLWSANSIIYDNNGEIEKVFEGNEIYDLEYKRYSDSESHGRMKIYNDDANPLFTYIPYYTDLYDKDNSFSSGDPHNNPVGSTYEIKYYPYFSSYDYSESKKDSLLEDPDYSKYINENCSVNTPEMNSYLNDTLSAISFDESLTGNAYRLDSANKIYDYFCENFYYTMSPGSTPRNRDFTDYFLNSQKRGFCAHFATATVLLLRAKGIPARYCEGYIIPLTLIAENGVLLDESFDDWYSGHTTFGQNSVISVEVNDSYAHAWVEIYLDGYGFVPFEATIPSFEEEDNNFFDITNFFRPLIPNNNIDLNIPDAGDLANNNFNADNSFFKNFSLFKSNSSGYVALIFFAGIFAVIALMLLIKWIIINIKYLSYFVKHDEYHIVLYKYQKLIKKLKRKKLLKKTNPLMSDVKLAYEHYIRAYNSSHKKQITVDIDDMFNHYENTLYS